MMRQLHFIPAVLLLTGCASPGGVPGPVSPLPGDICPALRSESPALAPSIPDDGDGIIRVLAFGDFGDKSHKGVQAQTALAAAMVAYDKDHPFDFGLTLGDNFYRRGLNSPTHRRWESQWERVYNPLGIRIYAVLGNHDYKRAASPAAEIKRSDFSATWCLPSPHYTFSAGPLQFFAVDTTPVDEPKRDPGGAMQAQLTWLNQALAGSSAKWKIVYGHHPVYSNGPHGKPGGGTLPRIKSYLLPALTEPEHGADVYLAGHDHSLQALEPKEGVHFFVSGAGGRELTPFKLNQCRVWAAEKTPGFTVLEADTRAGSLTVSFVGLGKTANSYQVLGTPIQLKKGETSACRRP